MAYVAMTRAKEELYLFHAGSRMLFGSTSRNKPSRFLSEVPEELTERSSSPHLEQDGLRGGYPSVRQGDPRGQNRGGPAFWPR